MSITTTKDRPKLTNVRAYRGDAAILKAIAGHEGVSIPKVLHLLALEYLLKHGIRLPITQGDSAETAKLLSAVDRDRQLKTCADVTGFPDLSGLQKSA